MKVTVSPKKYELSAGSLATLKLTGTIVYLIKAEVVSQSFVEYRCLVLEAKGMLEQGAEEIVRDNQLEPFTGKITLEN